MSQVPLEARVKVLRNAGYNNKFCGKCGTVIRHHEYAIGVLLDGHMNSNSSYGCYWFDSDKLELLTDNITEGDDVTMMMNAMMVKGTDYEIVRIKFLDETGDKTYPYALFEEGIAPGDRVVVKTGHHGFALADVVGFDDSALKLEDIKHDRQVVCKCDFTAYNNRVAAAERMIELKKQMDAKVKQLQSYAIYEMLAEKDPSLKEMLDELKMLTPGVK